MSKRKYKIMSRKLGLRGDTIGEFTGEEENEDGGRPVLWLPDGTPPPVMFETVQALSRAYQDGREDKAAELIPHDGPADAVRAAVRDLLLRILEAETGKDEDWITPRDSDLSYTVKIASSEKTNGTMDLQVGEHRKRFRIRILVEEL